MRARAEREGNARVERVRAQRGRASWDVRVWGRVSKQGLEEQG